MFHYAFVAESYGESIMKIDQHVATLWAINSSFFYETRERDFWFLLVLARITLIIVGYKQLKPQIYSQHSTAKLWRTCSFKI